MPLRSIATVLAVGAAATAATAHDFFLMPATFRPAAPTTEVAATIGSAFPSPEIVVAADRVASVAAKAEGEAPRAAISGPVEKALGLSLAAARTGPTVLGVALKPRDVEYGEDRIDLILGEYQVSAEAKAAVAALPTPRMLKVDSRRFAKTVLCPTRCGKVGSLPAHGFELEFVPVAADRFRLVERAAPLGNYPVTIATRDGKRHEHRTNAQGEVTLAAGMQGPTMLFASTLAPPSAPEGRFVLRLTSLTTER